MEPERRQSMIESVNNSGSRQMPVKSVSGTDSNAFLQLLVAQLRQQDPTSPTQSTEFFSQLAAFSSVEQAVAGNRRLDALASLVSASLATDLVGREVSSDGEPAGVVRAVEIADGEINLLLENGESVSFQDVTRIAGA